MAMELLKTALFIILITTTSARPMGWRQHHDADIADTDWPHGWMEENSRWISRSSESFSREESSESSESQSSEESSEEVFVTDGTTPVATTAAMTTGTDGDESNLTLEPDTTSSDGPVVTNTTSEQQTQSTPVDVTPPCNGCFTVEISTAVPITDTRGDN